MSYTPIEQQSMLQIGKVEFISPDEIKVRLDIDAPENISLTNGIPKPFPRINNYVLINIEEGFIVGQVEWITIEETSYPKRKGLNDFGIVDLPYPTRKMSLNPIGTISKNINNKYSFHRGVNIFPSVGDCVFLPSEDQLKSIIESGENKTVRIGDSPLVDNAEIKIDPNRLFGRHLAVLGNTGSGKSCSVAGLIRWSLEEAKNNLRDTENEINSRFIILDPNGEYKRAFSDFGQKVRYFSVEPNKGEQILDLPIWFWNTGEWYAFTQASGKTQKPILRRALGEIRAEEDVNASSENKSILELRRYLTFQKIYISNAITNNSIKDDATKFGSYLKSVIADLKNKIDIFTQYNSELTDIIATIKVANDKTFKSFLKNRGEKVEYFTAFEENDVANIVSKLDDVIEKMGGLVCKNHIYPDIPVSYSVEGFADYIENLAIRERVTQYVDFLILRIKTMLSDTKMRSIIDNERKISLSDWLSEYIGNTDGSNGSITIIDMSLVPAELLHILTAVCSRMIFESLQRYRKLDEKHRCLPTVLVVEEAHNFIKRYLSDGEEQSAEEMCCKVFEKIAKEGRKFGMGLVLSSQRPSELSPTVLSQCNSFLLHRINNDKDQELVYKFIPDNLKGLLRDLPSLPSRNAILLGWASELPLLVKMRYLEKNQQPQSDDPDFWEVWTRQRERNVDWKKITSDWQNTQYQENQN
ncbi:MAG: ATP-binding protein [Spirochaetia bacterium]|nr:ATP-binding protein [Spirochaetia bacterium]MCI7588645.1 ATP-binding protein [Spirochaetia bacterium]